MPDKPDPPDEWRVYEEDPTPDPEPADPPIRPYDPPKADAAPVVVRTSPVGSRSTMVLIVIAVAVLGVGVAVAIAIFALVGSTNIGGIDAKDPEDFAELVDKLEEERGTTQVFWVGLYTDYIIVDVPYTDEPGEDREISYSWRGGDLDESTRGTSTDQPFDLADIDRDVIDGMCDPVLELAEGAEEDGCYVFISRPYEGSETWFRVSASDEFTRSYSIEYDINGVEVNRTVPE